MGRRKITDPLLGGLPSRIYIVTFPDFKSSYEIAKLIIPGSSAKDSTGRILSTATRYPQHFETRTIKVSKYKIKTLIRSNAKPFLSKLAELLQLDSEELEILERFEMTFRRVMNIYLELTIKREPEYLTRNLIAFEEISNALCLTLYQTKICSKAPPQATTFSFTMLTSTLPAVLGISGVSNAEWIRISSELANTIPQPSIAGLYTKIRKVTSPATELALQVLEGLEKYYETLQK